MTRDIYSRLVYARSVPVLGQLAYYLLKVLGVEIPRSVRIGKNFYLVHGGFGVVIHPNTVIGNNVRIYPGVILGRADVYRDIADSAFEGFIVEDEVILGAGAKALCKAGILTIAKGSVIGANAVLTESTGPAEIWAGIPARRTGGRYE
jgi:serine O-acetyltransferase